jgi:copper oxidase (laccase) domain-containing protein
VEPATLSTTSWGTPALDLGAGVTAQLDRLGVEVHDVSRCTLQSPDLYSHRRDGARAGRFAGVIRRRP